MMWVRSLLESRGNENERVRERQDIYIICVWDKNRNNGERFQGVQFVCCSSTSFDREPGAFERVWLGGMWRRQRVLEAM